MMEIGKDLDLAALGLSRNDNSGGNGGIAESEDTFMTLMMTQLQNQDPFQPMEGGEFLTQLAQFEMVAGVNEMQASLESLASSMMSNQVLESAALVGKTVFAELSDAQLDEGGTIEGAIDVPAGASGVRVNIH
ncbi:MAG: flagellar hook assembly protein FlgD, partial [Gammaproteobacteria bacterium]|nr:flagellar hook assembly protein FlgD [Gammaproteobacteria bacterium]